MAHFWERLVRRGRGRDSAGATVAVPNVRPVGTGSGTGSGRGSAAGPRPPGPGETDVEFVIPPYGAEACAQSLTVYRRALRGAQKTALLLALVDGLLLVLVLVLALSRPEPVYFGMSQDLKLLPMTPLSEPVMNEAALKSWVAEAVTRSFNLDYLNWQRQLSEVRGAYTRRAFTRFALSLDKEGHLPLLKQQRALMHAVVRGTPIITRSGVVRGALVWEMELPVLVTYETSVGRISTNAVTVVCQVTRVPVTDCPRGVAISSLVTTKRVVVQ